MGVFDIFKKKKVQPAATLEVMSTKEGTFSVFEKKLYNKSLILLVVGKRGSGKTALGMALLDNFHAKQKKQCFVVGFEKTRLPGWIKKANKVEDVPLNAVVLLDEGALMFSARDPMKDANKMVSKIMAIARHKNLTLIFISQSSAMIDVNVLRLVDTLLLKEPSLLQAKFERKALRDMYDEVEDGFKDLVHKEAHVFIWDDDFQGMIEFGLPSFWSEDISTVFKHA